MHRVSSDTWLHILYPGAEGPRGESAADTTGACCPAEEAPRVREASDRTTIRETAPPATPRSQTAPAGWCIAPNPSPAGVLVNYGIV